MAGNTARLLLPYPVSTDTADVPRDVKALADRIEALTSWIRSADLDATALAKLNEPGAIVSALPAGVDGKVIAYQTAGMASMGVVWTLMYVAATGKWVFVGGGSLRAYNGAALSGFGTSYGNDAGINVGIPAAGDYEVHYGGIALAVPAGGYVYGAVAPTGGPGSGIPADATLDRIGVSAAGVVNAQSLSGEYRAQYTGAGTCSLYWRMSGASQVGARYLTVRPFSLG